MNEHSAYLVRAIRGPVILITIGVLFAFDRFTELRFSQTWPVLLIVIGVMQLAGGAHRRYYRNQQADSSQPGQTPNYQAPEERS